MIDSFRGRNFFLSNYYGHGILFEHLEQNWIAPTLEHAFHACKATNIEDIKLVLKQTSPGMAKSIGRQIKLRNDWEKEKDNIVLNLLRIKFNVPSLEQKLIATQGHDLIEGNTWHDNYWGVCYCGTPRCSKNLKINKLGQLLMQVRAEKIHERNGKHHADNKHR